MVPSLDAGVLRNLDLNLLLALDALLRERNVTRAAAALGLSQPAVSASLARLRRHFHDELLHRSGNRYDLTPLGERLTPRVAAALGGVRQVFSAAADFDPAADARQFTLMTSDYGATILGSRLAALLAREAPHARLEIRQNTAAAVDQAPEALRTLDGIVMPHGFIASMPSIDLYEDAWVCVVAADNDEVGDRPTPADVARLPWVATYDGPTVFTQAAAQLRMMGVELDVHIVVESFLAVPFLVSGTRRAGLLQERLARRLADAAGVRILPCPWEALPLKEALWWHPLHRADPAHAWFRDAVRRAGRDLAAPGIHTIDARGQEE